MLEKFWDKIGENIATEWSNRTLTLAFAFWGLGLLTYSLRNGWDEVLSKFNIFGQNLILSGTITVLFLILIAASNTIVGWFILPMLKILEGYWPNSIRDRASLIQIKQRAKLKNKLNNLFNQKEQINSGLTTEQEMAHIEYTLHYFFPSNEGLILPTPIGNIIKSAEEYPYRVYGLDVSVTWPHLWLIMPDYSREQVLIARKNLNESVNQLIWCLLMLIWMMFQWWVPILVIFSILLTLYKIRNDAFSYAQLLRTVYDIHRFDLYKKLHWKLPTYTDTKEEVSVGKSLTNFLYRHQVSQPFDYPKES